MTKLEKRAALAETLDAKGFMTVAELIALLKTYPQDAPVTGYTGQEETDLVTPKGVRLQAGEGTSYILHAFSPNAHARVRGPFLDIMGF